MLQDHRVALNFFPLLSQDFQFTVYRLPYREEEAVKPAEGCKVRQLPVDPSSDDGKYQHYWVSFQARREFDSVTCLPGYNLYLTLDLLEHKLIEKTRDVLNLADYQLREGFDRGVSYVLRRHPEGEERVWLEPYLLRRTGDFGFLADFTFTCKPGVPFNRRIQQLSLSLDDRFRENRDFYVQRLERLRQFIRRYFEQLFPLSLPGSNPVRVDPGLLQLAARKLDVKTYIFAGGRTSNSQFMGIKSHGPLQPVEDDVLLYFVYRPQDKPFSYDLYHALQGDTYSTFPGMERMFGYSLGVEHVSGVAISSFGEEEMAEVIQDIKRKAGEQLVVPVVLLPWYKEDADDQENYLYYWMKHRFLAQGLPTQFVSLDTLKDRTKLKWAVSNIALGIFAKMGGIPWKVRPRKERCLIIGIGQSHETKGGRIERYFAYSVLTDSSGLYEDLRILGRSRQEGEYLSQFKQNLTKVLHNYADQFDRFAIHSTFSLRQKELDAILEVLRAYSEETDRAKELVALKFNDKNKYFGYDLENNSMVPYESSYIQLSDAEYLVWFEGLQYHKPNVTRRIGGPMHVRFIYPEEALDDKQKEGYLQDALNLSGANWRGFNAKSSPVSVYYAYLIARYFREFTQLELEEIDLSQLTPWFL